MARLPFLSVSNNLLLVSPPGATAKSKNKVASYQVEGKVIKAEQTYKLNLYEQCRMFRILSTLINASISFTNSLEIMEQNEEAARISEVYTRIHIFLAQGHSLSSSLARSSESFSQKTVALLHLGEESGGLVRALEVVADDLEAEHRVSQELRAAFTYPLVVAGIALSSFGGLFFYLIPRMLELMTALDADPPLGLSIALKLHEICQSPTFLFLLSQLGLGIYLVWRRMSSHPDFELRRDRMLVELPLIRDISVHWNAFYFARSLSSLVKAGYPLTKALKLLGPTLTNSYIGSLVQKVAQDVMTTGCHVSEAMQTRGLFPPSFHQLLHSGEETGTITKVLDIIAKFHHQRGRDIAFALGALLEPAILVFLGLMVGLLALVFFLPLMKLIGQI